MSSGAYTEKEQFVLFHWHRAMMMISQPTARMMLLGQFTPLKTAQDRICIHIFLL
jgi:hypothetical protein